MTVHYKAAKVSGLLDTIFNNINKYLPLAVEAYGSFQKPKSGQAKGLQAITAFTQQVIGTLRQLAQAAPQGDANQIINAARQLRAVLDDHSAVYQAKKGDDAKVLNDAKAEAMRLVSQIESAYANTSTVLGTNSQGQLQTQQVGIGSSFDSILSNPVFIYGGVALVGAYLLAGISGSKKKK